ncbi:DNA-binding IclR family transcriptional regulator [Salirhabdus euzebyi]|uniref:Glycerol operon regulatory protein n=1 Tax=Salirhabdus euzebyi TaxID=394506 RepID=A0A841Q7L4_9BACI|nr:IclR family transcriptional regulator [Salirhabdus euzebyi]MBB6454569.1 DNA-binding IclR family transcriptional regulator [Salirhabdus euzebyi]
MKNLKIQALQKAFSIFELFASNSKTELSASEIGKSLNFPTGTLYRFLSDLETAGYLKQDKVTKKYQLGLKFLELGAIVSNQIDLRKVAFPYLEELRVNLNENVNLGILDGHEVVYLERLENARLVRINVRVGSRIPIHCSSIGKVLLANQPENKFEGILEKLDFRRFTEFTITDKDLFLKEICKIRSQGFAISDREFADDIRTVSAPIYNSSGVIEGAFNVSAPSYRLSYDLIDREVIPTIKKIGEAISRSIGFQGFYN